VSARAVDPAEELALLVRTGWRLIVLDTFEEERALRMLERVAGACERRLIVWSIASGLGDEGAGAGSLDAGLQAIESVSEPALIALLDPQRSAQGDIAARRLRDLLPLLAKRRQCVVGLGPGLEFSTELGREAAFVELPLPRAQELEPVFRKLREGAGDGPVTSAENAVLSAAARAALGLTSGEAIRVFRKACARAGALDSSAVSWIVREKRQALRRTPALSFHDAELSLEDVGGLSELKRWLRERRRAFAEEAEEFGLPTPRGLLLLGVQGCGKSLCAKAVAREWQFPLLRLDLAAAFGSRERSVEATVREAVAVAESLAPAVLWIDEIEKGFAASAADPRTTRVFGAFLTWLSEKQSPVFVVATANDVASLPPELLRRGRFDELFFVDLPSPAERVEILAIHLRKRGRDPRQFPLDDLATEAERLSGAELEQVVIAGLYTAFSESRDLTAADLSNAIQETVPLYDTYEERIKELRDWARNRARPATLDVRAVDLFQRA
jgi:AAA+ superfamily predicted ATPase